MPIPVVPHDVIVWAAGFFDGEGWVGTATTKLAGRADTVGLRVAIGQNDDRPLRELAAWWGGSLQFLPGRRPNQQGHWQWRLSGRAAALFLISVRPYLRVKGEPADVGLRFAATLRFSRDGQQRPQLTDEEHEVRGACQAELHLLNRVGVQTNG
jgi:hypothetical protein